MSIIESGFDEHDELLDQDILEILLAPLLPSSKAENPNAYKLVSTVLRRWHVCVQKHLFTFVDHVFMGTLQSGSDSRLANQAYVLIYELHKVSPHIIVDIFPLIVGQLQIEDEASRIKAVQLLGQLYASDFAEYASEHSRDFSEFLGRFNDLSPAIRLQMIEVGASIIRSKPSQRAVVEGASLFDVSTHFPIPPIPLPRHNSLLIMS